MVRKICRYSVANESLLSSNGSNIRSSEKEEVNVELFSYNIPVEYLCSDLNARKHCFKLLRKSIFSLIQVAKINSRDNNIQGSSAKYDEARKSMRSLFDSLSTKSCSLFIECDKVKEDIQRFMKSIGKFSDLFKIIGYKIILHEENSACFNLVHLYNEIYCHYVKFLKKISAIGENNQKLFEEFVHSLLQDLIVLSYKCFTEDKRQSNLLKRRIFICSCIEDLLVVIIKSCDLSSKSFWCMFSQALSCCKFANEGTNQEMLIKFKACLLVNIVPLYWIDEHGSDTYKEKSIVPGNWICLQELFQVALANTLGEDTVNILLQCAIKLLNHWNVNVDMFNILWDYFIKTLNKNWQVDDKHQNFKTFTKVDFNLSSKFDSYCSIIENGELVDERYSLWFLFIRYIVVSVNRAQDLKNDQFCSTLKRRIFSKFHKKQLDALDMNGLENFIHLFTVLSLTLDTPDAVRKLCSLVSLLQQSSSSVTYRKLSINAMFISILVCKKKNFEFEFVAQKCVTLINLIVSSLKSRLSNKAEIEKQNKKWECIGVYLEGIEYCISVHPFSIKTDMLLLSHDYVTLLSHATASQVKLITNHMRRTLLQLLHQEENISDTECSTLYENFYVPLRDFINKENSLDDIIIDCVAWFSLIIIDRNGIKISFGQLLNEYGFNSNLPIFLKCHYLNNILSSFKAISQIEKNNQTLAVINSWVNLVFTFNKTNSTTLMDFTQKLRNFKFIKEHLEVTENVEVNIEKVLLYFISSLGEKFYSLQNVFDMNESREEINFIFKDIIHLCKPVILKGEDVHTLKLLIKIVGHLVRYCAKAIYKKTAPSCLLPQIYDLYVLPLQNKPVSKTVEAILLQYLHLYLMGLATLDFKKDEFVARKLRAFHDKYFKTSVERSYKKQDESNPFFLALKSSCIDQSKTCVKSDYKVNVINEISDELYLRSDCENLAAILYLLYQVLNVKWIPSDMLSLIKKFLGRLLEYAIYTCEKRMLVAIEEPRVDQHIRKYATSSIQSMVNTVHEDRDKDVFDAINKFMTDKFDKSENAEPSVLNAVRSIVHLLPRNITEKLLISANALVAEYELLKKYNSKLRESLEKLEACVKQ